MNNYGEIFCTAVNELIKSNIANLNYDITKTCNIIAVKNKIKHEYLVSDGSSSFKAFAAEGTSYSVGDQVLVTIPNGDYNQQKTITTKIINADSTPIGYIAPFDLFISATGNLVNNNEIIKLQANSTTLYKQIMSLSNVAYYGFQRIGIKAKFMTLLDNIDLIAGEYGLKVLLYGDDNVYELTFSSLDMLGNPYMFNNYFTQECVLTIPSTIKKITGVDLIIYQKSNFENSNGPVTFVAENIFIKDVEFYFGYEKMVTDTVTGQVISNIVELKTDTDSYTSQDNLRDIELTWFQSDNGILFNINQENWYQFKDKSLIKWYQYQQGCPAAETDKDGGENWKFLQESSKSSNPFLFSSTLANNKQSEKFKAIVFFETGRSYNDQIVYDISSSNIIEFKNITENTQGGILTDEIIDVALSLHFDDKRCGNYFLYDENGKLINSEKEGPAFKRTITIYADGKELLENINYNSSIDWIRWEIPNNPKETMIIIADKQNYTMPTSNLLGENYKREQIINHTDAGLFIYSASFESSNGIKAKKIKKLIPYIYVSDDSGETWKKPYKDIIAATDSTTQITTSFNIIDNHNCLKIDLECYDENGNKVDIGDSDDNDSLDINYGLQPVTTFATKTFYSLDENSVHLNYSIDDFNTPIKNNNIIKCAVSINGKVHYLSETLRFGPQGTSGTDYTFLLEMLDGKNAITCDSEDKKIQVKAILIDSKGNEIDLKDEEKLTWTLLNVESDKTEWPKLMTDPSKLVDHHDIVELTLLSGVTTCPDNNYTILKAEYTMSDDKPKFIALLPIPIKKSNCLGMQGASQVIYNHQGLPQYGQNDYIAFLKDGSENKTWKITVPDSQIYKNPNTMALKNTLTGKALEAAPLYSVQKNNNSIIQDRVCVSCSDWSQPVLIMQSTYDFAMLNAWNGKLQIDNDNNRIMSAMLGAGKKDDNNKFSGILIGEISETTGQNTTETMTGAYGFCDGVMTYGLRENGTAFFGAPSDGRIEIDGENSIIRSSGWSDGATGWTLSSKDSGTLIDLNDGMLLMQTKDKDYIKFNANVLKPGTLEMQLSGANLTLSDKESRGLSTVIDATAHGIVTEVRRTAAYHGICKTGDCDSSNKLSNTEKEIEINFFNEDSFAAESATNDYTVNKLSYQDFFVEGRTISVTFESAQTTYTYAMSVKDNEGNDLGVFNKRKGYALFLKFAEKSDIWKHPIYLDGQPTSTDNAFGWNAGSTINFTYRDGGFWEVSDAGSYSRIEQTENSITSLVSAAGDSLTSKITQTAGEIRSEVARKAPYTWYCTTLSEEHVKTVIVPDDTYKLLKDNGFEKGLIVTIQFSEGTEEVTKTAEGKLCSYITLRFQTKSGDILGNYYGVGDPILIQNADKTGYQQIHQIQCDKNQSLTFMFNGQDFRLISLSASAISQTSERIRMSVTSEMGEGFLEIKENYLKAEVTDFTQSFGWKLNEQSFSLYVDDESDENRVFFCDKAGVVINGELHAGPNSTIGDWGIYDVGNSEPQMLFGAYGDYGIGLQPPGNQENCIAVGKIKKDESWENATFRITKEGKLYAKEAYITGTGQIGMWNLKDNWLTADFGTSIHNGGAGVGICCPDFADDETASKQHFLICRKSKTEDPFAVFKDGRVVAQNIEVKGGTLGGLTITKTSLESDMLLLSSTSDNLAVVLGYREPVADPNNTTTYTLSYQWKQSVKPGTQKKVTVEVRPPDGFVPTSIAIKNGNHAYVDKSFYARNNFDGSYRVECSVNVKANTPANAISSCVVTCTKYVITSEYGQIAVGRDQSIYITAPVAKPAAGLNSGEIKRGLLQWDYIADHWHLVAASLV